MYNVVTNNFLTFANMPTICIKLRGAADLCENSLTFIIKRFSISTC